MKTFKSTVLTSFFLAGLPASIALLLHFGGAIQIPSEGFVSVSFCVGILVYNYLSTMVYLFMANRTEIEDERVDTVPLR